MLGTIECAVNPLRVSSETEAHPDGAGGGAGVLRGQRSPATQVHKARSQGCVAVRDRCSLLGSEFKKTALATIKGFAIMGFIGFFVKLVFIPINVILVRAE